MMEITKREILFSIIIIAVMLALGFFIYGKISNSMMDEYQKYDTALRIESDANLFQHSMDTDIGYSFVYGKLKAVDIVSYPEIDGEYSYIRKETERYTMHTRVVTYYTGSGKHRVAHHKTETYWTWDKIDEESKHSEEISFLDVKLKYGVIELPGSEYIDTVKESSKIRYKYYGCKTEYTGTLFADLRDDTISDTQFFNDMSIEQAIKSLESGWQLVVFWVVWIVLIVGLVYGFYYLDNRWLE